VKLSFNLHPDQSKPDQEIFFIQLGKMHGVLTFCSFKPRPRRF